MAKTISARWRRIPVFGWAKWAKLSVSLAVTLTLKVPRKNASEHFVC